MKGILEGLKILDLTRLLPGAFCTSLFADYGAEVIKIESIEEGDYGRDVGSKVGNQGVHFTQLNRNKKSLAINLKTEEGVAIFNRFVKGSDVIVEGFRPDVTKRLGIDYYSVCKINPRIVYCSITGYGQGGPYQNKAGHDINYLSIAGLLYLNGQKNLPPSVPCVQIADIGGGALPAAVGILMALLARELQGEGQYVDISMMDSIISWQSYLPEFLFTNDSLKRGEMLGAGGFACYNVYQTQDGGYMSIGALEPKFWREFCDIVGRPDWFQKQFLEEEEQQRLVEEVSALFLGNTRQEWIKLFEEKDVCCEPLLTLEEMVSHPQIMHREMLIDVEHPVNGTLKQVGFPIKFSKTSGRLHSVSPFLGEHTRELMKNEGFSDKDIIELHEKKVIKVFTN